MSKYTVLEKLLSFEDTESENNDLNNLNKLTKLKYFPKDADELRDIINARMEKEGSTNIDANDIYVGDITDMTSVFYCSKFNGDISEWDVSNVEDMCNMFLQSSFNGDISKWNVSKVTNMSGMFCGSKFNGDISNWNVSNVKDMSYMFRESEFNGDISKWNVSNVNDMRFMFQSSNFNGDVSKWNVSNVNDMYSMFGYSKFTKKEELLSNWNFNSQCDRNFMFWHAGDNFALEEKLLSFEDTETEEKDLENFTQLSKYKYFPKDKEELIDLIDNLIEERGVNADLNDICTSQITEMAYLFFNINFNGDISKWDVSKVTNMTYMFANSIFDGDISNWDVSNVKTMNSMFYGSEFNGDISNWDVSNVEYMGHMFYRADFNKDISNWNVSKVKNMRNMFAYSKFTYKHEIENNWNIQPDCNVSVMFWQCPVNKPELQEKLLSFEDTETEVNDLENLNKLTKYKYFPKDKEELKGLIVKFLLERGKNADLNDIYTGDITDMCGLFSYTYFKGDISNWDVHNVKDMSYMFAKSEFNGDISKWDVSNVENMSHMFYYASFNGDISNWDVHNVRDMKCMFYNSFFNGDVSKWNINPNCNTYFASLPKKKKVNEKLLSFEDTETKDNDLENLNEISKYKYFPKDKNELVDLIDKLIRERGPRADLNDICTSQITNMNALFANEWINPDISKWDVSNVKTMKNMFMATKLFNGDISNWDVSNVEDMGGMFSYSMKFNSDISKWNVSNVKDTRFMFYHANAFDQDISDWDVSKVERMDCMFEWCSNLSFNNRILIRDKWEKIISPEAHDTFYEEFKYQNLGEKLLSFEDTESKDKDLNNLNELTKYNYYPKTKRELEDTIYKLIKERGINADLNDIYTGDITDMSGLFSSSHFNGDISKWDVSNVTNMSNMFINSMFNGDISNWNVSKVINMSFMFNHNKNFNGDISKWDVHNVEDMACMFSYSSFNGDISNWDVFNVEDMIGIFYKSNFDGDISKWNINPECDTRDAHFPNKEMNEKLLSFEDAETENKDLENLNKLTKYNYYPKTREELRRIIQVEHETIINEHGKLFLNLNDICTSQITDMSYLFCNFHLCKCDISKWDVSNVKTMRSMFAYSDCLGCDISDWDVSNVENMKDMFKHAVIDKDNYHNILAKWKNSSKCLGADTIFYLVNKPWQYMTISEKLLSFEDTESEDNDLDKLNKMSKTIENKKWFDENCIHNFKDYLEDKKDKNCTFVRVKKKGNEFLLPLYNYMNKTTYEILSPNMWFDSVDKFTHGFGAFSAVPDDKPEISNFINEKGELLRPDLAEQIERVIGFSDVPDAAWIKFKSDNNTLGSYEDYIRKDGSLVFNNLDGHIIFELPFYNYKYSLMVGRRGINFDDYAVQNSLPGRDNKGSDIYMLIKEKDKGYNLVDVNFNLVSPNLYFDKVLRPGSYVTNTTWVRVMKDGKFNYLNCATGEIISKDLWFDKVADSFLIKHKVAKVLYNGTYYFINENGELYEDADKTKKVDIEKIKSADTSKKDAMFEECWFGEADNYQNMPKYFFERRKLRNTEKNRAWYAVYILLSKYGIMRKDMILSILWPGKTGLQLELFQFLNSTKIAETIKSGPNRGYLTANKYNNWHFISF